MISWPLRSTIVRPVNPSSCVCLLSLAAFVWIGLRRMAPVRTPVSFPPAPNVGTATTTVGLLLARC